MTGLAERPGTDVEPTCSRSWTWPASAARDPCRLPLVQGRPGGVVGREADGPPVAPHTTDVDGVELDLAVLVHR
jgi:hypothetical protein